MSVLNDISYSSNRGCHHAGHLNSIGSDCRCPGRSQARGEEFTFSVTAANTGADAIGPANVTYHLTVPSFPAILQLKVPASPPARASNDPAAATLAVGSFVTSMFLFPTDNKLTVGDSDTISSLKGKALALGNANISFHIHAEPDLDFLFPKGTGGTNGTRNVVVVLRRGSGALVEPAQLGTP